VTGWIVLLVGVGARLVAMEPGARSVYPIFRHAGQSWLDRADLYPVTQQPPGYPLFRYSPPVAIAFIPSTLLPIKSGDLAWRGLNAIVLLGGLAWAIRRLPDQPLSMAQAAAVFLLLLPAGPGGFGNGQCNAMVIGFVLMGFAAAVERRFTLSAIVLAAATLLKLYPVAPALLLAALYPRQLAPRYILAVGFGLALPFVMADPEYVARQYQLWAHYFVNEDRSDWPAEAANIDLQSVISYWITPISTATYRVIEAIGGLVFAGLTLVAARRLGSADRAAWPALALGSVWMTTLGPATESPTYLLIAPATALAVVVTCRRTPADKVGRALTSIAWLLPVTFQLAHLAKPIFDVYRALGPQPIAALVLTAAVIWETFVVRTVASTPGTEPTKVYA
jgi:hypothetical protein